MSNEHDNEEELIFSKCKIFFERNIPIHIKFKNGIWNNGVIMEVMSDFFMLNEFMLGLKPVFYSEIKDIETYTKEREE